MRYIWRQNLRLGDVINIGVRIKEKLLSFSLEFEWMVVPFTK